MEPVRRPHSPLSYLAANAAERGEAVAVFDAGETVTFSRLHSVVHGLVGRLLELGLQAGEPVGVRLPNIWEYVALELAIPAAGGVIMPLPLALGEAESEWAIRKSGARLVIEEEALPSLFAPASPDDPGRGLTPILGPAAAGLAGAPSAELSASSPVGPVGPAPAPSLPDDPKRIVEIALTSGTTGMPKLAALSAGLKQATFEGFTGRLEVTESDRVLVMSPLTQGIGGMCLFCLRLGASLIMLHESRFRPETVLRLAEEHSATMLVGVPTNVIRLLHHLGGGEPRLRSVRVTALAGAPMPPDAAAEWEERTGSRVCLFYGSMDAGQLSVASPRDPREKRHHTVGRPHDSCRAMITAEGEICMRGPTVQERYWGEDHGPAGPDGWVHMGDLGEIDEEGYLHVVGRKKDLIIRGGSNINPYEVELFLRRHPAVADVCVVGRPDPELGERAVACIVPRGGEGVGLAEVRDFLAGQGLSRYKWPEEIRIVAEIPLSGPGKVNRKLLAEQLLT